MKKKVRNFIIFWVIAIFLLAGWYVFLQAKNGNIVFLRHFIPFLPIEKQAKMEMTVASDIIQKFSPNDNQERTILILLQNNMELRPGGGYIGTFAIAKVKNGEIFYVETHNTNNFDGRVPDGTPVPFPMKEFLGIKDWKMRDSNWSPDFSVNALKAKEFYLAGKGGENFDAIIAVNAKVLSDILEKTGPITVTEIDKVFTSENAVNDLEYLVEKGYKEIGFKHSSRKEVITLLAQAILNRAKELDYRKKIGLLKLAEESLKEKEIQLYFKDESLQNEIELIGWGGRVDENWDDDYLMIVDANLAALKSDLKIKRSFEYTIDLSQPKPEATLKIFYEHNGTEKDWMTRDYQGYLRVYVPKGSWLNSAVNVGETRYGEELGKKYFGFAIKAPMGKTTVIELHYNLPENIGSAVYDLLIQKQSGINTNLSKVVVIEKNGSRKEYNFELKIDTKISEL